ncbi:MAG: metallophosphoesterase, partial [Clostridia bacterium]|nr:metallophosphoesterase [Clostridia bacterium]
GGHEHQKVCVRTMEEEYPYFKIMREKIKDNFRRFDIDFESRIIGGVNVITANNGLDYYNAYTVNRFEEELEKGYPVVVFSHDPVDDPLLGLTEPYHPNVKLSTEDYLTSNRMLQKLLHDPRVKATFAGHWHRAEESVIHGKTHYVTDGLFKGKCRLIEIR